MPAAPSDRRVLVIAVAWSFVAGAPGRGRALLRDRRRPRARRSRPARSTSASTASCARRRLHEGSPLYFANPFGGNGFWLDIEDGQLVALDRRAARTPTTAR